MEITFRLDSDIHSSALRSSRRSFHWVAVLVFPAEKRFPNFWHYAFPHVGNHTTFFSAWRLMAPLHVFLKAEVCLMRLPALTDVNLSLALGTRRDGAGKTLSDFVLPSLPLLERSRQ